VKFELNALGTHVCLPLFLSGDLVGALILGKKKSDQEFVQDELDYFPTITSQAAIALNNARTMDIQRKNQIDFAQQVKKQGI